MATKLTCICMFCYGFVHTITKVSVWMATEDLVAGTLIQSSTVLTLFSAGDIVIRLLTPFIVRRNSFLRSMLLLGFLWLISYLLIVAVDDVRLRLAGVFFVGMENGLSNVVVFFLMAYFPAVEKSASAYLCAANVSPMVFALFYSGSTIWLCLPPRLTIVVMYPVSLLLFVCYGILNHGPLKKYQIQEQHQETQYKLVPLTDQNDSKQRKSHFLDLVKLKFLLEAFPFFGYFFVSVFCFFLAVTSVLTTLTLPSSPFRVRDHYYYYRLIGDFGMVLGGIELILFSLMCPNWIDTLRIKKILILLFVNFGHLMFFLFASWYHFVPNVYILLLLSGTHGIVYGSLTVRVIVAAANSFGSSHEKGLAMTITELGCTVARLSAGLIGVYVEEYLREHCTNNLLMGHYCLSRFTSSVGWNDNFQCQ